MNTQLCIIEKCEEPISARSRLAVCPLCRKTLYRWMKVPVSRVHVRCDNLIRYASRMEQVREKRGVK